MMDEWIFTVQAEKGSRSGGECSLTAAIWQWQWGQGHNDSLPLAAATCEINLLGLQITACRIGRATLTSNKDSLQLTDGPNGSVIIELIITARRHGRLAASDSDSNLSNDAKFTNKIEAATVLGGQSSPSRQNWTPRLPTLCLKVWRTEAGSSERTRELCAGALAPKGSWLAIDWLHWLTREMVRWKWLPCASAGMHVKHSSKRSRLLAMLFGYS